MKNLRLKSGFTLLEVLIVVVLVSFLGGVIYSVFFQGVRIWNLTGQEGSDLNYSIFSERIAMDLRSLFNAAGQFNGNADSVQFTALRSKTSSSAKVSEVVFIPRIIKYYYDVSQKRINMTEQDFGIGQGSLPPTSTAAKTLLSNIHSCRFEYYVYDQKSKSFSWQDKWQADCAPLAVRIKLSVRKQLKEKTFSQVMPVPVGWYKG